MPSKREIKVDFTADTKGFKRGVDKAKGDINTFSADVNRMAGGVTRSLKSIGVAFASIASIGLLSVMTSRSLDFADSIDKAAQRTGFAVQTLQELRFAGDQTGVAFNEMDAGLARFTKRLGLARANTGAAAKTYKQLGIDLSQNNETIFRQVVETLGDMDNATNRLALTTRLFGDDAQKLALTFQGGTEGLDQFSQKAAELGLVLDQDLVRGAAKANDELSIMKQAINIQTTKIFLALAPAITSVGNAFAEAAPKVAVFFDKFNNIESRSKAAIEETIRDAQESYRIVREKLAKRIELDKDPLKGVKVDNWLIPSKESLEKQLVEIEGQFLAGIKRLQELNREPLDVPSTPNALDTSGLFDVGATEKLNTINKKLTSTYKDMSGPLSVYTDLQRKAGQIFSDTRTPTENYITTVKELQNMLSTGVLVGGQDTFNRALEQAGVNYTKTVSKMETDTDILKGGFADLKSATEGWGRSFADTMLSADQDFGGFANSMINQLARIAISSATTPLFDAFGGFISGLLPGKAAGGPVMGGTSYVIGERGPEIFTPSTSGHITPNNALGAGGGVVVNVVESPGRGGETRTSTDNGQQVIEIMVERIRGEVSRDIAQGGGIVSGAIESVYGLNRVAGGY